MCEWGPLSSLLQAFASTPWPIATFQARIVPDIPSDSTSVVMAAALRSASALRAAPLQVRAQRTRHCCGRRWRRRCGWQRLNCTCNRTGVS
jgi:hypothetical protein